MCEPTSCPATFNEAKKREDSAASKDVRSEKALATLTFGRHARNKRLHRGIAAPAQDETRKERSRRRSRVDVGIVHRVDKEGRLRYAQHASISAAAGRTAAQ